MFFDWGLLRKKKLIFCLLETGGGAAISKFSLKTPKLCIFVGKYANKNAHFFMFWRQSVARKGGGDIEIFSRWQNMSFLIFEYSLDELYKFSRFCSEPSFFFFLTLGVCAKKHLLIFCLAATALRCPPPLFVGAKKKEQMFESHNLA